MGKDNNMYEEMDRIKQRIRQINNKYPGTVQIRERDKIQTKNMPAEERKELEKLQSRLQELKEQDDKAQGIKQ